VSKPLVGFEFGADVNDILSPCFSTTERPVYYIQASTTAGPEYSIPVYSIHKIFAQGLLICIVSKNRAVIMPHATARRTCSQTVRDECLYHYEGFDQSTVSMNTIVNCLVVTRSLRAAIAQ